MRRSQGNSTCEYEVRPELRSLFREADAFRRAKFAAPGHPLCISENTYIILGYQCVAMVVSIDKMNSHKEQLPQANETILLNTTFSVSHDSFLLPRQTCSPALMHPGVDTMDCTIHHERNPEKRVYMYIDHG